MDPVIAVAALSVALGALIAFLFFKSDLFKQRSEVQTIAKPELHSDPKKPSKPSQPISRMSHSKPHSHASDREKSQSSSSRTTKPPAGAAGSTEKRPANSMRSRRTPARARAHASDDGYSSDSVLKNALSDFKRMGKRNFLFIVGGATLFELRVCHKLTAKLQREVILGSTSIHDPPTVYYEAEVAVRNGSREGCATTHFNLVRSNAGSFIVQPFPAS